MSDVSRAARWAALFISSRAVCLDMPWSKRAPVGILASVVATIVCIVLSVYMGTSIGVVLFAGFVITGASVYAQLQHRRALGGERLKWLLESGFAVENVGRYWGVKGSYCGHFVRLYVDPHSHFHRRMGPDLCIMVYFTPMRRPDGRRDIALLRRIEQDILDETSWVDREYLTCHAIHMHQRTRFTLCTGRRQIQERLDRVIGMVSKYGLKPWPEEDVERWVQVSPDLHGPNMEEFQENFPVPKDAN